METPSQSVRTLIQAETEPIRMSVESFVGRQDIPCKFHQFCGASRGLVSCKGWLLARSRRWFIGFSWGGWVTGGAATKLADERDDTAVVAALTPICVEKFLQNSDAKANLAALQKISTNWEQGQYLEKGGWATRPGATSSDYHLARACAEKLVQAKTASQ
jgi:hypothetical protein